MSKTYILEPTELTFTAEESPFGKKLIADIPSTSPLYGLTNNEAAALIPAGAVFDINNGDKFIMCVDGKLVEWTRDGNALADPRQPHVIIRFSKDADKAEQFAVISDITTEPGTYTVSIYTGEDDAPKYPVKNTSYELHGHSDVERIRYKLKKKSEQGDSSDFMDFYATNILSVSIPANGQKRVILNDILDIASNGEHIEISGIDTSSIAITGVSIKNVENIVLVSFAVGSGPDMLPQVVVQNITSDSITIAEKRIAIFFRARKNTK